MAKNKLHNKSVILIILLGIFLPSLIGCSDGSKKSQQTKTSNPVESPAQNDDKIALKGNVYFTCDLKEDVVEKLGMKFIKEVANGAYKTNLFGASGTEITVKNSKNNIVGMGKANSDGSFSIPVENDNFYSVEINFKSKKVERKFSKDNLNNLEVDLGRFQGEEILRQ